MAMRFRLPVVALLALLLTVLAPAAARAQMTLDLRDVDLRSFVQIVAEQTQRNFIVDPAVSGTVTVIAPAPISPQTVYEIFLNVLELNQLTIIEGTGADRIVPIGIAPELSPAEQRAQRGGAFETRAIPVRNASLDDIIEVVLPLVPPEAVVTPIPSAGLLVISDRRENLQRIAGLVARLDEARPQQVETVRLRNGRATEMLEVIRGLEMAPSGTSLSADPRANAILVSGPQEYRDRTRALIAQLDTPQTRTVTRVHRLNYADARELAEVVRQSFAGPVAEGMAQEITVVAEPQSNALVISAPSDRVDSLVAAVRALDTRPAQVLIEAVIFEVSAENFSDLSVQFGGVLRDALAGGTSFSLDGRTSLITLLNAAFSGRTVNPGDGGSFGYGRETGSGAFAALLTALARERSTRLLSTPAVLTLNNQEAEIVVAQNVPFVTGTFATVGDSPVPERPFQTIQRQDVGLTLKVRPQITDDGTVRMQIQQEVSNLTGSASAAGGEITAKRTLNTNVIVGDGRVVMLGGLMEESSRSATERVPGISRAPVVGGLFRGRGVQEGQRVLLVMLRPRVIRNDHEATRYTTEHARQTEQLARVVNPRDDGLYPRVTRTGLPFDGVDLNQPFDSTYVDKAVRDRMFPALPPRLVFDVGQ